MQKINEDIKKTIQSLANQMIKQHCMLTEHEAFTTILQAIKSGDIMANVRIDTPNAIPKFTYKPYEMRELQEQEMKRLTEIINRNYLCIECGEKINKCICINE